MLHAVKLVYLRRRFGPGVRQTSERERERVRGGGRRKGEFRETGRAGRAWYTGFSGISRRNVDGAARQVHTHAALRDCRTPSPTFRDYARKSSHSPQFRTGPTSVNGHETAATSVSTRLSRNSFLSRTSDLSRFETRGALEEDGSSRPAASPATRSAN